MRQSRKWQFLWVASGTLAVAETLCASACFWLRISPPAIANPQDPKNIRINFIQFFFWVAATSSWTGFFLAIRSRDRHGAAVHGPKDGWCRSPSFFGFTFMRFGTENLYVWRQDWKLRFLENWCHFFTVDRSKNADNKKHPIQHLWFGKGTGLAFWEGMANAQLNICPTLVQTYSFACSFHCVRVFFDSSLKKHVFFSCLCSSSFNVRTFSFLSS